MDGGRKERCGDSKLTNWVFRVKGEFQSICLVLVQRVLVKYADVHLPFFEVFGFRDCDSGWEVFLELSGG